MAPKKMESFSPLPKCIYVWWTVIGLCPFVFVKHDIIRCSRWRCIYTMILILAYVTLYSRAVLNRVNFVLPSETSMSIISDFFGLSVEFLLVVASWWYFAFRQKNLRELLKTFENVYANTNSMGIGQNCNKILRKVQIHVLVINFMWMALFCCDHALLYEDESFKYAVWVPFNLPRGVTHNVVVMFVDALLITRNFFHRLNQKISNIPCEVSPKRTIPRRRQKTSKHFSLQSYAKPGLLEVYGQMHSDLVSFTKMIVNFFTLSIILVVLVHVIQMSTDLYIICIMLRVRRLWSPKDGLKFLVLGCWFLVHCIETVVLLVASDSTVTEANKTGTLLHKMLTADDTQKYVGTGEILSFRLLHRRLTISLWGLFHMRLSVMHTIIGTVGTYITIMMQLDSQHR